MKSKEHGVSVNDKTWEETLIWAETICGQIRFLKRNNSRVGYSECTYALRHNLYGFINYLTQYYSIRQLVSVRAQFLYRELAKCSNVSLVSKLENPNDSFFHLEHAYPNTLLFTHMSGWPEELLNGINVLLYIVKEVAVVWILNEENDALNTAGFKTDRPGGWEKCYEEVGIVIWEGDSE